MGLGVITLYALMLGDCHYYTWN